MNILSQKISLRRILGMIAGVVIIGIGIAVFKFSHLGNDSISALNLRLAGMEAVEADSAEAALPLLEQKPGCDAAILDVMLPGMNGFSLCETIRRTDQKIGIIILSAKGQEQDKIRGLSIGADDYMTKPFSVSELLARVEALCRRVGRSGGLSLIHI